MIFSKETSDNSISNSLITNNANKTLTLTRINFSNNLTSIKKK